MRHFRFRVLIPGLLATLVLAGVLSLMSVPDAHACTCVPSPPPGEALEQAQEVFSGEVVEVTEAPGGIAVRFNVSEAWKGVDEREIEVGTPRGGSAACGFEFQEGNEYLVYTSERQSSDDPDSVTGLCYRTAALADAGEDLDALGEGTPAAELAAVDSNGTDGGGESFGTSVWLMGGSATLVAFILMAVRLLRR